MPPIRAQNAVFARELGYNAGVSEEQESEHEGAAAEADAEYALAIFEERLCKKVPFAADRRLVRADLRDEARPTAHALIFALTMESALDETSLEHHECVAMTNLLGRRAALLGASPTTAAAIVNELCRAIGEIVKPIPLEYVETLSASLAEGYARGLREAESSRLMSAFGAHLPVLQVGEVRVYTLAGPLPVDLVQERLEAWGKEIFRSEIPAVVLDISGLPLGSESMAATIAELDAAATVGGARCAFSGVRAEWKVLIEAQSKGLLLFESLSKALEAVAAEEPKAGALATLRGLLKRAKPGAK